MADPVEALVLGSFAGAIDSMETEIGRCSEDGVVETVVAFRHWLRPSRIGIGISVGSGG
jgi:hypothetical protein